MSVFDPMLATHPCIQCIYFKQCGSTTRTEKCAGRVTKSMKKSEEKPHE